MDSAVCKCGINTWPGCNSSWMAVITHVPPTLLFIFPPTLNTVISNKFLENAGKLQSLCHVSSLLYVPPILPSTCYSNHLSWPVLPLCNTHFCIVYRFWSNLKMEAAHYSRMLVHMYQSTWCHPVRLESSSASLWESQISQRIASLLLGFISADTSFNFFPMALQPPVGQGLLMLDEVSRSHTMTHPTQ